MSRSWRSRPAAVVALLLGASLTASGYAALQMHGTRGTSERRVWIPGETPGSEGTLVAEYAPASPDERRRPAVVLLHGYLANAGMLERPYAVELAERGILTFVPYDFLDYQASRREMVADTTRLRRLAAPVLGILRHVQADPRVDPDRIGLLGHSYGASLAIEAACADWSVSATVAMAGSLESFEYVNHVCPRNLLLVRGDADRFSANYHQQVLLRKATRGIGDEPGRLYGDVQRGNARFLLIRPDVGHVTVLFDQGARQAAVDWLETSLLGASSGRPVRPLPAVPLFLGVMGLLVLVEGTALLLLPRTSFPNGRSGWLYPVSIVAAVGSFAIAQRDAAMMVAGSVAEELAPPLVGAEIYLETLMWLGLVVLPIALLGYPMLRRSRRHELTWQLPAVILLRMMILFGGLSFVLRGYYNPWPAWDHLRVALHTLPLCVACVLSVALAARSIEEIWGTTPIGALGSRLVVAVAAGWLVFANAERYNDVTLPAIHVVSHLLAGATSLFVILSGARNEPTLSRVTSGALVAVWVQAVVFPLR